MKVEDFVVRGPAGEQVETPWGALRWWITDNDMPGVEMTFGRCLIRPGQRNPLHSHPDCEEFLHVLSGACEHRLDDATVLLRTGDTIRIPRGVKHWARALGDQPLLALIMFSSGKRTAIDHEGGGVA